MKSTRFNLSISLPAVAIQSNFDRFFLSFETLNTFLYYIMHFVHHTLSYLAKELLMGLSLTTTNTREECREETKGKTSIRHPVQINSVSPTILLLDPFAGSTPDLNVTMTRHLYLSPR